MILPLVTLSLNYIQDLCKNHQEVIERRESPETSLQFPKLQHYFLKIRFMLFVFSFKHSLSFCFKTRETPPIPRVLLNPCKFCNLTTKCCVYFARPPRSRMWTRTPNPRPTRRWVVAAPRRAGTLRSGVAFQAGGRVSGCL